MKEKISMFYIMLCRHACFTRKIWGGGRDKSIFPLFYWNILEIGDWLSQKNIISKSLKWTKVVNLYLRCFRNKRILPIFFAYILTSYLLGNYQYLVFYFITFLSSCCFLLSFELTQLNINKMKMWTERFLWSVKRKTEKIVNICNAGFFLTKCRKNNFEHDFKLQISI